MKWFLKIFLVALVVEVSTFGSGFCEQDSGSPVIEDSITLNRAIEIALQHNRSLQRSLLTLTSSKLSVKAREDDFNIKIIPGTMVTSNSSNDKYVSGQVRILKETEVGITGSITPRIEQQGDLYTSSVNVLLNVPLLNGFGTDYALDGLYSARYDLESSEQSYYQQQVNTVIKTVSTVYEIIKDQQQMGLLNNQLSGLEKHLMLTKMKEKTGLATAMDLYRAELRLKDVQNEMTTVNERFDNHVDQLKDLLSIAMQGELTVTAPVDYEPVITHLDEAVAIALENRIEIEQSKRRSEESRRKMLLARNNILPRVDLDVGYRRYGANSSFQLDEEDWTIGLNGSSDLARSQEKTAFEQANIRYRQSKIDLESTQESVVREVRAQINQMKKNEQLIVDRREQARQTEGKLELALSKFNHGLADNFDLLEAQTEMQQVKTDLLFDTIGYIVDTYKLRSVLGTLLDR